MSEPKNKPEPESNDASMFEEEPGNQDWWQDMLDIFEEIDFVPGQVYVRDTADGPWREVVISDDEPPATETPSRENEAEE